MRKIELLCPASSLEVLKIAVIYGADAVYIGGEAFGLRAKAKNFSMEEMAEGIGYSRGGKPYRRGHRRGLPGAAHSHRPARREGDAAGLPQ